MPAAIVQDDTIPPSVPQGGRNDSRVVKMAPVRYCPRMEEPKLEGVLAKSLLDDKLAGEICVAAVELSSRSFCGD